MSTFLHVGEVLSQHVSALSSQMYLSVNPPLSQSVRLLLKILTLIDVFLSSRIPQSKPSADPEL